MTVRQALLVATLFSGSFLFWPQRCGAGEPLGVPIVRIAELEIDSAQLDAYRVALREEIETSIHVEPGVLTLYAVMGWRSGNIPAQYAGNSRQVAGCGRIGHERPGIFSISTQGFSGNIAVIGSATAGGASLEFVAQQLGP